MDKYQRRSNTSRCDAKRAGGGGGGGPGAQPQPSSAALASRFLVSSILFALSFRFFIDSFEFFVDSFDFSSIRSISLNLTPMVEPAKACMRRGQPIELVPMLDTFVTLSSFLF